MSERIPIARTPTIRLTQAARRRILSAVLLRLAAGGLGLLALAWALA